MNVHTQLREDAIKRESSDETRGESPETKRTRLAEKYVSKYLDALGTTPYLEGWARYCKKFVREQALIQLRQGMTPNVPMEAWRVEQWIEEAKIQRGHWESVREAKTRGPVIPNHVNNPSSKAFAERARADLVGEGTQDSENMPSQSIPATDGTKKREDTPPALLYDDELPNF